MSTQGMIIDSVSHLTEYRNNYRNVNIPLQFCYMGLSSTEAKLSELLFILILKNKMYNERGKAKSINEDKRIYSDIIVSTEDLARDIYSIKYADGEVNISSDISNLDKRIYELHDNNIFYCWRYRGYFIFIMEREVFSWKYYNPNAYIPPKTIKKILNLANDIMTCMGKHVVKNHGDIDGEHFGNAFGMFLNDLIGKLNPVISSRLQLWINGKESIAQYCVKLSEEIGLVGDFDGIIIDSKFILRLPKSVRYKIKELVEVKNMKIDKNDERARALFEELVPNNKNIARRRVGVKAKKEAVTDTCSLPVISNPAKPVALVYGGNIDIFKDPKAFIGYYRMFVQTHVNSRARFDSYASDVIYSSNILDSLIDKHKNNKEFVDSWMDYFCKNNLKGTKCMKAKYTSMKVLLETLEKFCKTFYVAQ